MFGARATRPNDDTIPMPYLIFADRDAEFERRELDPAKPLTVGRSAECDVAIRDILLSRKHCVVEKFADQWVVADLGSKNGTFINGEQITRHVLEDGDVVKLGRERMCFREGKFVPPPPNTLKKKNVRPVDPHESLAGTVLGMRLTEDEEGLDQQVLKTFPRPKPRPAEPAAMKQEQVYAMLADIASSSWDQMLADTKEHRRPSPLPTPILDAAHEEAPAVAVAAPEEPSKRRSRIRRALLLTSIASVAAIVVLIGVWVMSERW